MENLLYKLLKAHAGHRIEIAEYGDGVNFALEDMDTNEVIFDTDAYDLIGKENDMERQLYYVSQSHCGHEYVWIYDDESLLKAAGKEKYEYIQDWLEGEDSTCVDILFPMGGSNSSATYIVKLNSEEEARDYLVRNPAYCDDYDDPMLIDIAEYIYTVDTDEGSITQEILDKFGLNAKDLEQDDYRYDELIALGIRPEDFYEERCEDRYSEVIENLNKQVWVIGICSSDGDGVGLQKVIGTKEQVKQYLLKTVHQDLLEEYDSIEDAVNEYDSYLCTETIDDIAESSDGKILNAYATFYDHHVDYVAIVEDELPVEEL